MDESRLERELAAWAAEPVPARFPFMEVVGAYHLVGKHFVGESLLKHLDVGRSALAAPSAADALEAAEASAPLPSLAAVESLVGSASAAGLESSMAASSLAAPESSTPLTSRAALESSRPSPSSSLAAPGSSTLLSSPVALESSAAAPLLVSSSPAVLEPSTPLSSSSFAVPGPSSSSQLARFLDVLLDKFDERYDYQTYLALSLLPMPDGGEHPLEAATSGTAQRQHDRLLVQLGADALHFELAALDGHTERFPLLRPDPLVVAKRCRLGLRALVPALERLGLAPGIEHALRPGSEGDPLSAAREVCARVRADATAEEQRVVDLTVLPVWTSHDEYLFIRVLQSFENLFALLAVRLRAALDALGIGHAAVAGSEVRRAEVAASEVRRAEVAASEVRRAEVALEESFRLFSLLATMQIESFQDFRRFTEGASAIQSRNYKLVESLCRIPDPDRLDSAAYRSVPELRERVIQGPPNLDDAVWLASQTGALSAAERDEVTSALHGFAAQLLQWRQTHYRLAVRMLGDRPGTGYTEGTPYLKEVRTIPVFRKSDPAAR